MVISDIFIRRPIMTTLIMIAILLFGLVGYKLLPVSDLPNVDFPTINVSANLPGASPDTMASAVATPLERQFSTIAGLDSMSSSNSQGITNITLTFSLDRSIDAAAQDVQSMISKAAKLLPPDMPSPPSYQKVNPADQPILYLAVSSPVLPLFQVYEYADTFIAQRISMINGVAQVLIFGSQKYAVRAQLDPKAIASRGIGINEVASAVQKANVNLPTGILEGSHNEFTIQAAGQLYNAAAYRPLVVSYRNGMPVRLDELGKVIDSVENDRIAAWYTNRRGMVLAILRQPGTNTIEIVDAIKNLLPKFRQQIPASVDINVLYDRSSSIRNSVEDVKFTLFLSICLVVLVIFLFLRNISATIIPSLALPMSIIGTFAVMYLTGYSIDNLSLMALVLAVGFIVDDAIVMLENIMRHIEQGESVREAALKGSKEIGFTILSMTISLVAVFIPVLFMPGILGRLLHEFAIVISTSILVSGVVSLTLTPMLCSRFIHHDGMQKRSRLFNLSEKFFSAMLNAYERSLQSVLKRRRLVMAVNGLILIVTIILFVFYPKGYGFIPNDDTGRLLAFTEGQQGIAFESMKEHQKRLADIVRKDHNVGDFMSAVGPSGISSTGNIGRIFMRLKDRSERDLSADEIIKELTPKLAAEPGMKVFIQNPPLITIGGRLTKSPYQFTLQSTDTDELYKNAVLFEQKMAALPLLIDVASDLQIKTPQVNVTIDRDKAASHNITAQQIEDALQTAYSQEQISTIYAQNNQYQVIMELLPEYQKDPSLLSLIYIKSNTDQLVPLSTLTSITQSAGPLTINHSGQFPSVTISFNTRPDVSLGEAVGSVEKLARQSLPAIISASFQGQAQAFKDSLNGLWLLLVLAIIVIYIVLGILYESFIHPITILSGLPSAGFGALITLMLFGYELNIYSFVGIIMLIGIVKKNAIMMIDFALEAQRNEGKTAADAIFQGCIIRFRPIMMTTMAALMGTLPIALGFGAGSQSRRPLGLAVVGGLLFSQLITLYLTPVFYTYMESLQKAFTGMLKRRKAGRDNANASQNAV
ncbi:MAG TPA: efflux RND transporter permease subunit [Dissulfurispiraceae bacterium]|nr:efflux RND transporter permease subunit [Dissulfurispiraceae bacterium]